MPLTGIKALDEMLGLREFPQSAIVLLKGGSGSGKTTLALQIIDRHLTKPNGHAVLISLEKDPQEVIAYAADKFAFSRLTDPSMQERFRPIDRAKLFSQVATFAQQPNANQNEPAEPRFYFADLFARSIEELACFPATPANSSKEVLIVVDTLNVLANLWTNWLEEKKQPIRINTDPRVILHGLLAATNQALLNREEQDRLVILFVGEFHPGLTSTASEMSESFVADVEILLSPEPVTGHSWTPATNISAAGYNIEVQHPQRIVSETGVSNPVVVETRPFCRVLKCRMGSSQGRRCVYDIVDGKGIRFLETYPGDGYILLFAENDKQRMDWEEFLTRDIPDQYPALRYKVFDRKGLQRTFATQRRFMEIPERTDMHLACFDTYWIEWYRELYQRNQIAEQLSDLREQLVRIRGRQIDEEDKETVDDSVRKEFCRIVCMVDNYLTPRLGHPDLLTEEVTELAREIETACNIGGTIPTKTIEDFVRKCWRAVRKLVGLCHPLAEASLRLFGESGSRIIPELEKRTPGAGQERFIGPVHRPRARDGAPQLLCVPYNANVSFIVYRKELLAKIATIDKAELKGRIVALYSQEVQESKRFVEKLKTKPSKELPTLAEVEPIIDQLVKDLGVERPPVTWEELLAVCELMNWQFLVETQTFDSLLCAFLEIIWGCGADISIAPNYRISDEPEVIAGASQSLFFLRHMFMQGITPQNSTLEPASFANRYPRQSGSGEFGRKDWAFARHWYSTFVDVLTAKTRDEQEFIWKPVGIELEIMPIPCSLASLYRNDGKALPVSCWGEWHFAVLRGTENERLAVELLNNLMSSQKITERASRCAALPTVEAFYEKYGHSPCITLPEREDIVLPRRTYNWLRNNVFEHARSRTSIFDYRHCLRELHGVLEEVRNYPETGVEAIGRSLIDAVRRIRLLSERELLLH